MDFCSHRSTCHFELCSFISLLQDMLDGSDFSLYIQGWRYHNDGAYYGREVISFTNSLSYQEFITAYGNTTFTLLPVSE